MVRKGCSRKFIILYDVENIATYIKQYIVTSKPIETNKQDNKNITFAFIPDRLVEELITCPNYKTLHKSCFTKSLTKYQQSRYHKIFRH